jgi:hypothetical protein
MVFDLLNINIEIFSVEDIGQLRVSLHEGSGGSHPREGRSIHIHESVRRGPRNQAPLIIIKSPLPLLIGANKNNKHTFWMINYSQRLLTVIKFLKYIHIE